MSASEYFKWSDHTDRTGMGPVPQRYYFPQLLQNVTYETARRLLRSSWASALACPCPGCVVAGAGRVGRSSLLHYIHVKHRQLAEQMAIPAVDRIAHFTSAVNEAQALSAQLAADGYRVKHHHFRLWLGTLEDLHRQGLLRVA